MDDGSLVSCGQYRTSFSICRPYSLLSRGYERFLQDCPELSDGCGLGSAHPALVLDGVFPRALNRGHDGGTEPETSRHYSVLYLYIRPRS